MTIDLNKEYKTKQGNEVKLLLISKGRVLGAFLSNTSGDWVSWDWSTKGQAMHNPSELDLVEVVAPVSTVVYCRVYSDGTSYTSCVKPLPLAWFEKQYKKTVTFTEDDLFID